MNFIRRALLPIILLCLFTGIKSSGQSPEQKGSEAITLNAIQAQLAFIASDLMEGRETGSKGEYLAGEYIASMLQLYGIKPGGDVSAENKKTYFQNFTLQKSVEFDEPVLSIRTISGSAVRMLTLVKDIDFHTGPFSKSMEIEAPVAYFSGCASDYNNIDKSDVKGKFIIMPEGKRTEGREYVEIERLLRSGGASGIIGIVPVPFKEKAIREYLIQPSKEKIPGSPVSPEMYSLPGNAGDDFIRLSLSEKAAKILFEGTGIDPGRDTASETSSILQLNDKKICLRTSVKTTLVPVRNVIGIIEGNHPDEGIVLGAHYDHMGIHDGYIWNGADDNGSGTTGVLTLAKAIAETGKKPGKTILFAFWTAEEKGLLGSRYYVQNSGNTIRNIKLNVNFDMISRYVSVKQPSKVTMTYTSSYPFFRNMTRDNLQKYGIDLDVDYQPSPDPPGGTDHRSFVSAGIPVMRFKPGHREEYHTPLDDISTIDWDIMEKIIRISFLNVWQLANSEW